MPIPADDDVIVHCARTKRQKCGGRTSGRLSKSSSFIRTFGGVAGAVGVGTCAGELSAVDNQVFLAYWLPCEPALQNFARACRIARLR